MKEGVTMTTQMIIRLESTLKNKVSQLAKAEGKNVSELVRELLEKYTKERDASAYIDNLWDKIGQNLAQNNISESDIEKAIKHVRSKNA
jgi:predicted DNA-binding protein